MDKNAIYLGIDSSTTATKAIAWSGDGRLLSCGQCVLETASPQSGFAEQDASDWWTSTQAAVEACLQGIDPALVKAIGITVQRETFVLLDERMEPVAPAILWYDSRAVSLLGELHKVLDPVEYHTMTGKQLDTTSAVGKLLWLSTYQDALLRRASHFADVLAYLSWKLTGNFVSTPAGIDTTGLIELASHRWCRSHLELAGVQDINVPSLVGAGQMLGNLTDAAADTLGLKPQIPVVAGGGDGHCFAFAASCLDDATASLTLGTSAVLGIHTVDPVLGEEFRTLIGCAPGKYLLESVIQCGSATLSWFENFVSSDAGNARSLSEWDVLAERIAPGADGLLALPYWRGCRVPHNDAKIRGVTIGWHDRHTQAHFYRALLEALAMEFAGLLGRIQDHHTVSVSRLILGGGGACSDTWCQIIADSTGLPCCRPETVELTNQGAALLAQAYAEKVDLAALFRQISREEEQFLPRPAAHQLYAKLIPLQQQLYHQNAELSHRLFELSSESC